MKTTNLITSAIIFATKKHSGQKRKYNNEDYICHPLRVMGMVSEYTADENVLIASVLHDTLEDTDTTYEEIVEVFNVEVADLVLSLTSDKDKIKELGKAAYLSHKFNNNLCENAKLIKLCDRLDNCSDIPLAPESFAIKYSKQTNDFISAIDYSGFEDIIEQIQTVTL